MLVTTHYLDEAEYCNQLVLMHAGRIVAHGSPGALKREVISGAVFEVDCADPVAAMEVLRGVPSVGETAIFGTLLHVGVQRRRRSVPRWQRCGDAGLTVSSHARIQPSLEDVFIRLIDTQGEAHP